jgi:hypothetical protein
MGWWNGQAIESLSSKSKALISNPNATKTNKQTKKTLKKIKRKKTIKANEGKKEKSNNRHDISDKLET